MYAYIKFAVPVLQHLTLPKVASLVAKNIVPILIKAPILQWRCLPRKAVHIPKLIQRYYFFAFFFVFSDTYHKHVIQMNCIKYDFGTP